MTAPYKPTLTHPPSRGAWNTGIFYTCIFHSFLPGASSHSYALRRQRLKPSVLAIEYWNGTSWVAGLAWNDLVVPDGTTVAVTGTTAPANNTVYSWSMAFRNAALEVGAFADDFLVDVHDTPTLSVVFATPNGDTRPRLNWAFNGAPGRKQKSYQFGLYTEDVAAIVGFDPGAGIYQALASWFMTEPRYSGVDYTILVGEDLPNSTTFKLYYRTSDDMDLMSDWTLVGTDLETLSDPPSAPLVTPVNIQGTGVLSLLATSTFNLLSAEASSFETGISQWEGYANCQTRWNEIEGRLRVEIGGMTYSQLDAGSTTFADETGDYTTFEAMRGSQASPIGTALARHTPSNSTSGMIPVLEGQVYSAIATFLPITEGKTCAVEINWYTAAGAFLSTSSGSGVAVPFGVAIPVPCPSKTAPATAAFAQIQLNITSGIDHVVEVDFVAFSNSDSVEWTPGGSGVDISFVAQRSIDDGVTWEYIWFASRTHPKYGDAFGSFATILDRAAVLGKDGIKYRVYATTSASGSVVYSAPTEVIVDRFNESAQWVRCVDGSFEDCQIRTSSFQYGYEGRQEAMYPQNAEYGLVITTSEAPRRHLQMNCYTLSRAGHEKLYALLKSGKLLYLQRNIGDGFYFYVVGRVSNDQRRASDPVDGNSVRHYHTISFSAEEVSPLEADSDNLFYLGA